MIEFDLRNVFFRYFGFKSKTGRWGVLISCFRTKNQFLILIIEINTSNPIFREIKICKSLMINNKPTLTK
jgi:hypothetical protein